jgi:transcriptional antiterminator RfaH
VDTPLFPSYVFVYLSNMEGYYRGMEAEGTLYYVRSGPQIARVNETVVNNIKLATSQMANIEVSDQRFQPGNRLVINRGALTGLSCEVVEFKEKKMLLVRVELLRRNLLLSLPTEHVLSL